MIDAWRDAEVGHLPFVDRRRLEDAIERAAERRVDKKVRVQDAVVVNGLVVAAELERAVAGCRLRSAATRPLRPRLAGRRIAEERRVEAMHRGSPATSPSPRSS